MTASAATRHQLWVEVFDRVTVEVEQLGELARIAGRTSTVIVWPDIVELGGAGEDPARPAREVLGIDAHAALAAIGSAVESLEQLRKLAAEQAFITGRDAEREQIERATSHPDDVEYGPDA